MAFSKTQTQAIVTEVKELLAAHREVRDSYAAAVTSGDYHKLDDRTALLVERLVQLGDLLTKDIVCGTDTIDALISKWTQHGYRPTLRGNRGSKEWALADIYDFLAARYGRTMEANGTKPLTAYRGCSK